MLRLAILGCGAVTERLHLPAAREVSGLQVTLLVDRNIERATSLARRFGIPAARDTLEDIERAIDGVLVALPNRLHAPVSVRFLARGIPVLVEKPMALSTREARGMIEAAQAGGAVLQVGQMKRFSLGAIRIKDLLDRGHLGTVTGFSIDWGEDFHWPLTTDSGMNLGEAGGGVLVDFGSHLLDLLCWWLGQPTLIKYADDNRGGLEADCALSVGIPAGVTGEIRFSRLREFPNTVRIYGDRLSVEWDHLTPDGVRVRPTREDLPLGEPAGELAEAQAFEDLFVRQLGAFVDAVASGGSSAVSGESVVPSVELIEQCYRERQRLTEPWDCPVAVPGLTEAAR